MDCEWSQRQEDTRVSYTEDSKRLLSLYERDQKERLSKDEYAWLAERGYVKTNGESCENFKALWQIVILKSREIQSELLSMGDRIKEKYQETFEMLKTSYVEAMLESIPAHLKKVAKYESQFLFYSDGWFLLHCMKTLLNNGKLKEPTKGQQKALMTMIAFEK